MGNDMRLELATFDVEDMVFTDQTALVDGVLHINKDELLAHLSKGSPFQSLEVDIARPGESTRIVHTLDVVEPRTKASGQGQVFPGLLGPPVGAGEGRTLRLNGIAVIGAAEPFVGEDHWAFREGIIDMSGPGAEISPFSKTANLVITFLEKPGKTPTEEKVDFHVDAWSDQATAAIEATRTITLKAAEYLARAARGHEPDRARIYELSPVENGLPKVVYIHHNTGAALYGWSGYSLDHAMLLHPNELMDGALVLSKRMVEPAIRDCTYFHQNNSIIEELYRRHGEEVDFAGMVFFSGSAPTVEQKDRESDSAVKLAQMLGADGAVIAPFRPGHGGVGFMMVCQKCERAGIGTAIGVSQLVTGGGEPGLNHWVPEANAMVISGSDRQKVQLPSVDKVIGGMVMLNTGYLAGSAMEVEIRNLYGVSAPMGPTKFSGRLY